MSAPDRQDVRAAALGVLNTPGPAAKAGEALRVAEAWRRGALTLPSSCPLDLPERPAPRVAKHGDPAPKQRHVAVVVDERFLVYAASPAHELV